MFNIRIFQVLAESEQMRREADDIGPRAELDHWKKRMSKFNFLLDQIKSAQVKAVLGVLNAAKSKTIKVRFPPLKTPFMSISPSLCLCPSLCHFLVYL